MERKTSITAHTDRQTGPPALPVKQRRSQYSRSSSVDLESDGSVFSPLSPQHQGYSDVFPEPTDCHATKCPIHRRYDPSECHLERFFSEGTPPPVPKKRLARFMSLPGYDVPPPSPLFPMSPLQLHRESQSFNNPLYMLAPLSDVPHHREKEEAKPVTSLLPSPSLSQLCFDTPDEQLSHLFSHFSDQTVVFQRIHHHHLLFLRSMSQNVNSGILLQQECTERNVGSYQPQEFLLCEGYRPRQIGGCFYYSLHSPRFPGRVLGAMVHKLAPSAHMAHTIPQSSHVNLQEVIIHFTPDSVRKQESALLRTQDPSMTSTPSDPQCTAVKPPCGGSVASDFINSDLPTVLSLLEMGYCVSVERDLPQFTLEDFIQETQSLKGSDPLLYERQLCIIFLQLVMGLQHLYSNRSAAIIELRAQNIFLLWPENKMEQDSTHKGSVSMETDQHDSINKVEKGAQMLWRKSGTPRVVLAHQLPYISPPPATSLSINSQTGALLQYCLHTGEKRFSLTEASIAHHTSSPYKKGLTDLACKLQDETSGFKMADTVAFLQVLLWGPSGHMFTTYYTALNTTINNWLAIKCALLVIKLAENGLVKDQSSVDWEDCLCMQYLSFCDCETVRSIAEKLSNERN